MTRSTTRRLLALAAAVPLAALAACGGAKPSAQGSRPPAPAPSTSPGASTALRLDLAWSWPAPPPASAGMPAADREGIALTAGHEELYLLDGKGTVRWKAALVGLRDVPPALTGDLVLATTDEGVVAFDRGGGRRRWEAALGERANTPVVAAGKAVVTTWEGTLAGLDLADGRVSWKVKLGGPALGPAAAGAGAVVASFDTGESAGVVAVDPSSGRQRWRVAIDPGAVSAPAVVPAADTVVLVASDVAAHGLSLEDGSERWRRPLEGAGSPEVPPLALPDGRVVVGHRLGGMALLDARDGALHWDASSRRAAVRGGPAGPGPNGWFVLPLHDGTVLFADEHDVEQERVPGLVTGVAAGPGGVLLIGTGQGDDNGLYAVRGW